MAERSFWCPLCEAPHDAEDALPASCALGDTPTDPQAMHDTLSDMVVTTDPDVLAAGTLIGDRYVVEQTVGEGSMGRVYRARDLREGRDVALKAVRGAFHRDSHAAKRFWREAETMAALHHPGVVRVFDFGVIDANAAYLAMELLQGQTLGARLDTLGRLRARESCSIACQVLATLSAVHRAGFVHRDIKPANVFLADVEGGCVAKLLDFGLSRETRQSAVRLTAPGVVLGTPFYMSSAVIAGAEPSSRSDVYSVALLLFEMVTGDLPVEFCDEPLVRTFTKILHAPRRHPHVLNPSVPADLAALLAQAVDGAGHFEHAYDFLLAVDATQGGAFMNSELSRLLPPAMPERGA